MAKGTPKGKVAAFISSNEGFSGYKSPVNSDFQKGGLRGVNFGDWDGSKAEGNPYFNEDPAYGEGDEYLPPMDSQDNSYDEDGKMRQPLQLEHVNLLDFSVSSPTHNAALHTNHHLSGTYQAHMNPSTATQPGERSELFEA